MILSDTQLTNAILYGWVKFTPGIDLEVQVQPASIDLRLGPDWKRSLGGHQVYLEAPDWDRPPGWPGLEGVVYESGRAGHFITVKPGDFMICSTLEIVTLPDDLVGRLEGRSSLGRLGLEIHSTAGFIDPGFRGPIALEVKNVGKDIIHVPVGHRVCQLTLQTCGPVSRPYGPARGSRYQDQEPAQTSLPDR